LQGQLRGCIGSLEAYRPLIEDVQSNAVASAFRDPRFLPLSKDEFAEVVIEVSLLSKPKLIRHNSEEDALAQLTRARRYSPIRPNVHLLAASVGAVARTGILHRSSERKGRAADNFWSDDIQLSHYTVQKWKEIEPNG